MSPHPRETGGARGRGLRGASRPRAVMFSRCWVTGVCVVFWCCCVSNKRTKSPSSPRTSVCGGAAPTPALSSTRGRTCLSRTHWAQFLTRSTVKPWFSDFAEACWLPQGLGSPRRARRLSVGGGTGAGGAFEVQVEASGGGGGSERAVWSLWSRSSDGFPRVRGSWLWPGSSRGTRAHAAR